MSKQARHEEDLVLRDAAPQCDGTVRRPSDPHAARRAPRRSGTQADGKERPGPRAPNKVALHDDGPEIWRERA